MKKTINYILIVISVLLLTVLTQVGGVALIIGLIISRYLQFRYRQIIISIATYLILTFLIIPFIAPILGRERVNNTDRIRPTNYLTVLLNRNYVRPELNQLLTSTTEQLPPGLEIRYLDANFPFLNKFPLLPHLSHNDGKKIDISLMYETNSGTLTNLKPSRTGYGVFVQPTGGEFNQTDACQRMGHFQYDFPKYLTLGSINSEINFSSHHTSTLIKELLKHHNLDKVFLEKHLVTRMKLNDSRFRFQGCRSVRHDDHIHIQIK